MIDRIKKYFQAPKAKAIVLMYHRIADVETDPWQLAVSPEHFESQIKMLTDKFQVLPVDYLSKQLASRQVIDNSIYITFDDAYVDNYLFAKPILEKYTCPATFFIPTHFIGKQQQFWWDELEAILLHSELLPSELTIVVDEKVIAYDLNAEHLTADVKQQQRFWRWPDPAPTSRCDLYLKIWEHLKPMPYQKILVLMEQIRTWANYHPNDISHRTAMSTSQLRELSDNKLFSLGLHTQTHPELASHSKDIQSEEILGCRNYLMQNNYSPISAIAYPYGSNDANTILATAENQIDLGFTTKAEVITNDSLALSLGRFQINNYGGVKLEANLNWWLKT